MTVVSDIAIAQLLAAGLTCTQIGPRLQMSASGIYGRIVRGMERTGATSPEQWAAHVLPGHSIPGAESTAVHLIPPEPVPPA